MSIELKIKAKHLALEPAIIKKEIKKLGRQLSYEQKDTDVVPYKLINKIDSLHCHLIQDVKREARATHLVRGFMSGKKYSEIERNTPLSVYSNSFEGHYNRNFILGRMVKMYQKYGPKNHDLDTKKMIEDWLDG